MLQQQITINPEDGNGIPRKTAITGIFVQISSIPLNLLTLAAESQPV
jgi:hypothetical protein